MDALILSRIQFGISIGFHYLFPVSTLGLAFFILIFETLHLVRRLPLYRDISVFLVRLLSLIFTVGVATGLLMPFTIGAGWSRFSIFAGPVFGLALTVEAMTAFALESAFLAILVFGRSKVSPRLYWFSAFMVFMGSHLSAFIIVVANSWMQTPTGFAIENGQMLLTSFWKVIFNPSTLIRFVHVITAAWLTGAFILLGLAGYYAARGRYAEITRVLFRIALPIALVASLAQPLWGHFHILNVLKNNPEKDAAYEGIFHSTNGAMLYAFGIPDEKNRVIHLGIGMPYALSLLESGNPLSRVKGLEEFPREDWPPVNIIFTTFHLMVMLGVLMILVSGAGVFLNFKKKLEAARPYLLLLPWLVPLPYLANELGWIGAEIGRQPWVIYKVLRTAEASSSLLPVWQIASSITGIVLVYTALFILTLTFLFREIRRGPETH